MVNDGEAIMFSEHIGNYSLYLENNEHIKHICSNNYMLDENTSFQVIENGFILPIKKDKNYYYTGVGGVCDINGNFIAGHKSHKRIDNIGLTVCSAYAIPNEFNTINETVVYGGLLFDHFGHFITECMTRMWWFLENPSCEYKFIFIVPEDCADDIVFIDYLCLIGLKREKIIILRNSTRFDSIIIPDQTHYIYSGYKRNILTVYDKIRDSVPPSTYDKVYFTRTKLCEPDIVNEEYFVEFFRSKGYNIIAPEQLSVKEQISIIAGAREYACVGGSLHHHILFGREQLNVIILNRFNNSIDDLNGWINQVKRVTITYIDVSMNLLPYGVCYSLYLLMPNNFWYSFVFDHFGDTVFEESFTKKDKITDYIDKWCKMIIKQDKYVLSIYKKMSLVDFIISYNKYILNNNLDDSVKSRLIDSLEK